MANHLNETAQPTDVLDDIEGDDQMPAMVEVKRDSWSGKAEFLCSCISYAVGLGNVWRFPYLCYKNGGGAFLIPFVCMLLSVGIPLMYLETCFGQYSATGPLTVWKVSPLFTGLGWSMLIITFSGCIYYNMLIAWTLFYFWKSISSISGQLPWVTCSSDWNTGDCMHIRTLSERNRCWRLSGFFSFAHNHTCLLPGNASWMMEDSSGKMLDWNASATVADDGSALAPLYEEAAAMNATGNASLLASFLGSVPSPKSSSDEYFHNFVLSISNGFHDIGTPRYYLVICLLIAWIVVALCLIKGIRSAGKAVYFTGLFPYVVLTILLIRGLTLDGSIDGLKYFFIPKWEKLADPNVWGDAAIQVFFSLASGWGGVITLSSYNKFNNGALLDSLIVSIGDGATSIYAGMTVFCVLGYMSHVMSVPIDAVAKDGAGLAFILYPDIVTSLPVSPLWAALFFAMLLTLGFGTMISNVNTLTTAICDNWHHKLHLGQRPLMVLIAICLAGFLLGLPCTTQGGMFVLQLLDNYCCTYSVLLVGLLELIVIAWIYGSDNFLRNVAEMNNTGRRHKLFWKIVWQYFSPLVIVAVAGFTFASVKPSKYGLYVFPVGADIAGGVISVLVVMPIPAVAIYKLVRLKSAGSFAERIRQLVVPHRDWQREMGRFRRMSVVEPPSKANGKIEMSSDELAESDANNFESQQPLTHHRTATAPYRGRRENAWVRILRGSGVADSPLRSESLNLSNLFDSKPE